MMDERELEITFNNMSDEEVWDIMSRHSTITLTHLYSLIHQYALDGIAGDLSTPRIVTANDYFDLEIELKKIDFGVYNDIMETNLGQIFMKTVVKRFYLNACDDTMLDFFDKAKRYADIQSKIRFSRAYNKYYIYDTKRLIKSLRDIKKIHLVRKFRNESNYYNYLDEFINKFEKENKDSEYAFFVPADVEVNYIPRWFKHHDFENDFQQLSNFDCIATIFNPNNLIRIEPQKMEATVYA